MKSPDANLRRIRRACRYQNAQMVTVLMQRPRGVRGVSRSFDSLALVWRRNLVEMSALAVLLMHTRRL